MVKPRFLLSLILVAVLAVACSPASPASSAPAAISPTQKPLSATSTVEAVRRATLSPAETLAPTPFPVVTSRGPHLEATDPKTVNMAAGGLQFVEFFEFW